MLRAPLAAALAILLLIVPERDAAADVPRINCRAPHQLQLDLTPKGKGPLTLASVYCQFWQFQSLPRSEPIVSPDGQSIAYYEHTAPLRVIRLDGDRAWTEYPADLGVFARFGSEPRTAPAFRWTSDSRSLWSATADKVRPNGWALSPMQPVRTGDGGQLIALPPLTHDAGTLDALLWAGADGLAVAQFGTRGGFYRPERPNPTPTFAIVDAARGTIRDTFPMNAIETTREFLDKGQPRYVLVRNAAATELPNGKVRALLSVAGSWADWTEGAAPRVIPDPYARENHSRFALSPDGSRLLVGRLLRSAGGICGRVGGCRPGTPVEGVLAALHDVATGQAIWSIRTVAENDHEFPTPSISPDGRYALIGLMPDQSGVQIALVAMNDGRIVQTFPAPGGAYAMGFARGGRTVWAHAHAVTALYDLRTD